ncbi:MAG: ABC-three component system protein [Hyphomicrobiaceae bacterium]|nr:ABC-three component system protein [Hyphomicrobiaceae bacterium]
MVKRSKAKHLAGASLAGSLFQLERALCHLASPEIDAVGIEHVDDVASFRDDRLVAQEQDKHTVSRGREVVGDRSRALWRTLQIWVGQRRAGSACGRYLLAVNTEVTGGIARLIKHMPSGEVGPAEIVASLRAAGARRRKSRASSTLQTCIDDVLLEDDVDLATLVSAIEIVDGPTSADWRNAIVRGAALDETVDQNAVLLGLSGWLSDTLLVSWRAGQPGVVTRQAFIRQCRELERSLVQRRLLPRPASDVPVTPTDRSRAMARRFVDHLVRIDAERDDVVQAIDHFLQFAAEKWRLAKEGGIPSDEWKQRGDRLQQRWANIARMVRRENTDKPNCTIGQAILARTTYDHHEPINGHDCRELYMTSGHYHRLADTDEVWWCPGFQSDNKSDDAA